MSPRLFIAGYSLSSYYFALLGGIAVGWIAFILSEKPLWTEPKLGDKLKVFTVSSLYYCVIMVCCIQGATYFHYLFDNIPPEIRSRFTLLSILTINPIGSTKVLYGAIFFYPLGVFLISLNDLRNKFIPYLDGKTFVLCMVVGFNRVGCFLNGCCYGVQSDLLGIRFPFDSAVAFEHWKRGLTPGGFMPIESLPVIPTQLIEAIFLFGLSFFSWRSFRRGKQEVFIRFTLYYAIFRFLIEFLRDDMDRAYWWFFSASQWLSLLIILAFFIIYLKKKKASPLSGDLE